MDRFEHGAVFADICRAGEAYGSGDLGGNIGEDIAVEVGHNDDIKDFRGIGKFGGADIDDPVFVDDVGIFFGDFVEDFMEEPIGDFEDIVFGEAGHFFAAVGAGVFESIANDFFAAWARDDFEGVAGFGALAVFDACVEIFFIFADDDHVHFGVFGFDKGVVGDAGAHVGIEAQGGSYGYV